MINKTSVEYDGVIRVCRELFLKKSTDYGTAWRILRISSITDQIFIKAQRIRTLEEKKISKVGENITSEYIGIVNYCIIAMMQIDLEDDDRTELPVDEVEMYFDKKVNETKEALQLLDVRRRRAVLDSGDVFGERGDAGLVHHVA